MDKLRQAIQQIISEFPNKEDMMKRFAAVW